MTSDVYRGRKIINETHKTKVSGQMVLHSKNDYKGQSPSYVSNIKFALSDIQLDKIMWLSTF